MSILDYFSGTPRAAQREVLLRVEAEWNNTDVFVIAAPVATGKSRVAAAIAGWCGDTNILTPTNVLVEQYADEFPHIATMRKYAAYPDKRSFLRALMRYKKGKVALSNYYTYMAHKAYKNVAIFDEAHNLIDMLTGDVSIKLWQHLFSWDDDLHDTADLLDWLENHSVTAPVRVARIDKLRRILDEHRTSHLIELTQGEYRGKVRPLLKLTPLDARSAPPILWPNKVRKVVLMSATINATDIYDLGLDDRRVCYIECDSPIPPVSRPFIQLDTCNMALKHRQVSLPLLAAEINRLMAKHPECGVIHCTYAVAKQLRNLLDNPRFMWHNKATRSDVYQEFLAAPAEEGRVLIASGLYEGVDLAYDKARWQLLSMVPWQSLADPAIQERLATRPEAYAWSAIRTILQGTGRVCRTPTDRGITYSADTGFNRLYNNPANSALWPRWFKESVR